MAFLQFYKGLTSLQQGQGGPNFSDILLHTLYELLILGSRVHIKGLKWMKSDSLKGVFNFVSIILKSV